MCTGAVINWKNLPISFLLFILLPLPILRSWSPYILLANVWLIFRIGIMRMEEYGYRAKNPFGEWIKLSRGHDLTLRYVFSSRDALSCFSRTSARVHGAHGNFFQILDVYYTVFYIGAHVIYYTLPKIEEEKNKLKKTNEQRRTVLNDTTVRALLLHGRNIKINNANISTFFPHFGVYFYHVDVRLKRNRSWKEKWRFWRKGRRLWWRIEFSKILRYIDESVIKLIKVGEKTAVHEFRRKYDFEEILRMRELAGGDFWIAEHRHTETGKILQHL